MTGRELAALRRAAGLSQCALARQVGIGRDAVSYWERKAEVDLSGWAVKRMRQVLALPEYVSPIRTGWTDTLAGIEAALAQRLAEAKEREAARAAKLRRRCAAKTRKGSACQMLSEPGKRRCKFHGGMSTGAKTPEGLDRIREAQIKRWAKWRAGREL